MLRTTRASAVRAKTSAVVTLQSLVVTAPNQIRDALIGLTPRRMVRACAQLSPERSPTTPAEAAIAGLGMLARRYEHLEAEAKVLGAQIARLVRLACPGLLDLFGVGPEIAATVLVAVGDNAGRIGSEGAFANVGSAMCSRSWIHSTVRRPSWFGSMTVAPSATNGSKLVFASAARWSG